MASAARPHVPRPPGPRLSPVLAAVDRETGGSAVLRESEDRRRNGILHGRKRFI